MSDRPARGPPSGIEVLVIGAGVGGLMAALELWRNGCEVRIIERSANSVQRGDNFSINSTGLTALKYWPSMQRRNAEIAYDPIVSFHRQTGEAIGTRRISLSQMFSQSTGDGTRRAARYSRPKFFAMILEQAEQIGLKIEYGKEAIEYFEDVPRHRAGVVLQDSTKLEADLVIAADGVRGQSWRLVAGKRAGAKDSGISVFRVGYPVEMAIADPLVADRFKLTDDGQPIIEFWTGPGMYVLFERAHDRITWIINHPDLGIAEESWSNHATPEKVLAYTATIPGWPEAADSVIKATPRDQIIDFKVMLRDPQPKWTSPGGYVVQVGDTAHTFLPSAGSGATQALEDAVSLAACIAFAGKDKIPEATRVHNLLRFERVAFIQILGIINRRGLTDTSKGRNNRQVLHNNTGSWLLEHDPEQYAVSNYTSALAHLTEGLPFKNVNKPTKMNYEPFTVASLTEALEKGEGTFIDGDWS